MSQIVELGWIPVKQDYENLPATKEIKELHSKAVGITNLLAQWESVQGPGGLNDSPCKSVHLAAVWSSVEAADAAKQSPDGQAMRSLWGQVIDMSSPSGPVLPWTGYFDLKGDDFAKVADAKVVLLTGCYLSVDVDAGAFQEKWQSLMRAQASSGGVTKGYVAGAHGWSIGEIVHKGEKKKVFMVATGWESEDDVKAVVGGDKSAKFEEALKDFNMQQQQYVCNGMNKVK
ncbi:rieske domain-containing protein [Colletotrichum truncatum]|uniref:Rieske domain-containing protein n=1 Tax=Colletotrichum truncatum TaxID=5467 RepID=A0ACC3Z7C9_COLTU|nr:rieske domain-containing protein [Colletotrichum truncatum]KAF6785257.1 rieske domain-containing protein [Colletotrichum truncatum]